jgi:hypothetical protein
VAAAAQKHVDIDPVTAVEIEKAYKTPRKIIERATQIMDAAR